MQSIFLLLLVSSANSFAQVDPATSLLVRPSTNEEIKTNLDSSRYTVKPTAAPRVVKSENTSEAKKTEPGPSALVPAQPEGLPQKEKDAASQPRASEEINKNVTDAVREIIMGGDEDEIVRYREQLHEQDPRQNIVSLSVAPGFMYADASSDYWYRRYNSSGPSVSAGVDIWISPFAGLNVDYFTTLASSISADPTSDRQALVDHRMTSVGFLFRRFSSLSRKASSLLFGVDYADYQMIVPKAESHRAQINATGLAFSVLAKLPQTSARQWFFGAQLLPKIKIQEEKTALELKSGESSTAYGVRFQIGQEFIVDRQNQIFWRLSHRVDKTVYEGSANQSDPITGSTPSGVSVTSGMTLLEIGYTWGD